MIGVNIMRKLMIFLLVIVFLAGCGRGKSNGAAAHLGNPTVIQIQAEGFFPVILQKRAEVNQFMKILEKMKVRPLSVEEELELVLVQGKTLDAVELRFKESSGAIYKALLLSDDSVLVVDGARGDTDGRRETFLSEPGHKPLRDLLNTFLAAN
jgi:hypothetical protein